MVVGVAASRLYPDMRRAEQFVRLLARDFPDCTVLTRGLTGAEQVVARCASEAGLRTMVVRVSAAVRGYRVELWRTDGRETVVQGGLAWDEANVQVDELFLQLADRVYLLSIDTNLPEERHLLRLFPGATML